MAYVASTLLLFAGLGLGLGVLVLSLYCYRSGKKTTDLMAGAISLVFIVRAVQGLLQQSSGIACSMISGRGLALYGLSAAVLAGLMILYLKDLSSRGKRNEMDK